MTITKLRRGLPDATRGQERGCRRNFSSSGFLLLWAAERLQTVFPPIFCQPAELFPGWKVIYWHSNFKDHVRADFGLQQEFISSYWHHIIPSLTD